MKTIKILFAIIIAFTATQSVNAQKAKANSDKNKGITIVSTYTCPMHPDVTSDKPGKCSKCSMDLSLSKKEIMKREVVKLYTCPMHSDVTSDKPGKCSQCGANLNLSLKEKMKMEVMKIYKCPMHSDVASDKPGKCSKCNMDLTVEKNK